MIGNVSKRQQKSAMNWMLVMKTNLVDTAAGLLPTVTCKTPSLNHNDFNEISTITPIKEPDLYCAGGSLGG